VGAPSFVAVGDVMVDVSVSGRGHAARVSLAPGGAAVNAALWAAAEGADATVVGRVGDDLAGRALRAELEQRAVRTALSVDSEAPTGTFLIVDGEARADRGANAAFEPAHLPDRIEADAALVSGYLPAETVAAAIERTLAPWIALAPGRLGALPPGADAVLVDEDEALRLTGGRPEEAARVLARDFRLVCVTRGPEGAVAILDGREESRTVPVVEGGRTFGAGDAFAAALLVALVRGLELGDALEHGCRLGAAAVRAAPPIAAGVSA
jgi:sugar/nucleoside kinase (ribokinase family)